MRERRLPKLGLLGLMTDDYEPNFPGITARQEAYAQSICEDMKDVADIYFPGAAMNRADIENKVKAMNQMELDGMLIILLTYSQGSWIVNALKDNRLPLGFAVVQPDQTVGKDWYEIDLTVNQGVHGAQDNANAIFRMGLKCQFFVGNRTKPEFKAWIEDFGKAAQTYTFMKHMKVGAFEKMHGMNDILTDEMAVLRKLGIEIQYDTIGIVSGYMKEVTEEAIEKVIERDRTELEVDPKLNEEDHREAVRMYLAFKRYLDERDLDAFTAHFDIFSQDGRFRQLPLLAASHLMADGYGYAAEGDYMCAAMMAAAHCLGNDDANFTEMYTMDFERNAIIFCHAGEGNWNTHDKSRKARIIDRFLAEGGLSNPPTPRFSPEAGRATLTSLASISGDRFRLLISLGDMLPEIEMPNNEMPYFFWRPDCGPAKCVENWIRNGGTHHEVINLGDVKRRWEMLADMLDIEVVHI